MENLFDDGEICPVILARCRDLQNKKKALIDLFAQGEADDPKGRWKSERQDN